jgi:anti-anti-sigma factor
MYQIKGKIDSANAPEFEKELMAALPTEIDAAELAYISSAGLRVLLKLTKSVVDVTVCNVSPEVYEILDVTGFTSILSVKKALREIDVTGKEKLGQGAFGTVYRLDDERIVKVYRSDLSLSYIEREQ